MTRTSGFDFGSDPTHQWDTKREPFHLAEVRALPNAVPFCAVSPSCHSTSDFSFVCEQDMRILNLLTDSDETWSAGWVGDKDQLIRFW